MPVENTDVLISGAGAAGLTLAIELARRNVAFRLIDKSPEPFAGSRGKAIQPRTQEIFEDMGIVDRIAAAGGLYPVQRTYSGDTHKDEALIEFQVPSPAEPYGMAWMLPQFLTEAIMRDRLTELGAAPRFAHELVDFRQDSDGVTATIRNAAGEQTIRACYLVGTDGGRSLVRHQLGVDFPGTTLGVRAVVADMVLEGLKPDAWHRWHRDPLHQLSICPLRGTELFQLQAPVPSEGDIDLSAAGLNAMIADRTGRTDIKVHAVRWASVYTMNARLADRYRADRVFLAGDAAHIHPPMGGQGLNTSVQDAYNLGWKIAADLNGAPAGILASYESERRPVAAEVLGLSTRLLDAARERDAMRRGRETHQLDLGYPESPLSLMREHDGRVRAGDRAPDAPCRGAGGQPTHLFNLFQGTHWTLLGFGTDRASIGARPGLHIHTLGERGDIVDDRGHIHDAYGIISGWVLVRPDGYLSAVVSGTDTQALQEHLERVGLG